ncbi:MAG: thioredoxin family protein, partial [Myxococcales bacterium]|nr:thioredoxin family protein [Myxococcales bacterium]
MGIISKLFGGKPKVMPTHVDDSNFQAEVMRHTGPVILDVWGPGCAPCKQFEPILVDLATQYDGRVKVCEMSTTAAPMAAGRLRVMSTPSIIYFKRGREVERVTGMRGSLYHQETIQEFFEIPPKAEEPKD